MSEKQSEKILCTQSELQKLTGLLVDGILEINTDDTICYANPSAARLFCRSQTELIGKIFGYPVTDEKPTEITLGRENDVTDCY